MMKKLFKVTAIAVCMTQLIGVSNAVEVSVGRFFGACEDAGSNTKTSVGEACVIQSIINAANDEIDELSIQTLPTDWGNYYDQIKASFAGGTPPDVFVMHRHRVAEFASLGAIAEIGDDLESVGINQSDWTQKALDAVTYEDRVYGVPMDIHANLWHLNMDIFAEAGLVKDGKAILPSSPEELLEQAQKVKQATGKNYLAADFAQFPLGVRFVLALIWQQGENIFAEGEATINTPEAKAAVKAVTQLFDAGLANPKLNYADSQQAFLNGEAAVLVNGTWVVDAFSNEANKPNTGLNSYQVADFPTLFDEGATWADSHMWVIPASVKADAEKYNAALKVLAFINDHNIDWARTGHIAVRKSVLESEEYKNLPHRAEYVTTAQIARDTPPSDRYGMIQDVLNSQLQAIWLTDQDVAKSLELAEQDIQSILER